MTASRGLDELVERQVRRWSVESRAEGARRHPCIALSRQPGSGATELGHRVAERIGYGFFGIEIVDQIAREQGISRRLVEGLDEHVRTGIERFVADSFRNASFTESDYLRHVVRTIATLGERGGAVILGRGATSILQPELALRVLITAPVDARVARLRRVRKLDEGAAKSAIQQEDDERRTFLRHHFGVDPDDPSLYDVCLNTESFGLDAAGVLIVEALRLRFPKSEARSAPPA